MSSKSDTYLSNPGMNWLAACQQLEQQGQAYCIATVLAYVGSVPRSSGAKMVISAQGQFDTLGGGNLEYQVIAKARENLALQHAEPIIERFALSADLGQCCGGAVQVMFEYFQTQTPQVAIFGAGHVCQSLTNILSGLSCHVKVIDSRPEWLAPLAQKGIETKQHANPVEAIKNLKDNTFVLIMTQDHALDFELTQHALESQRFAYVGLIGSQGKSQRFRFRLKEQLTDINLLDQLTCPIGHPDITGKLPMEVAVSVSAQLMNLFKHHHASVPSTDLQLDEKQRNEEQWRQANIVRKNIKENHQ
ncbi:xanthine dehydrogenase accessory protein XdhC [Vibrio sp. EA2]|uniref:xanthine dehydrogenase accessory protein XdhC n=1 Tax=Vibrio sp. EA2 TaxID=3079860 RepID=UPI0029499C61|nr:xanthine dehydrogenase accessory protein XdhC [Vibrio sp. EA2]MDV6252307.1 xanthine dehydrogenase accessory protein XdhC [Vibrio sp. EA2]